MKTKLLSLLILSGLLVTFKAGAQNIIQSLETKQAGQGEVKVNQDPAITQLFEKERTAATEHRTSEPRTLKATGYRIQVFAGNNSRDARNQANVVADQVKSTFPELTVYTYFSSPRWLCRVGDFRGIEEANAMMRKLKSTGNFKEVSIVKEQINIHY